MSDWDRANYEMAWRLLHQAEAGTIVVAWNSDNNGETRGEFVKICAESDLATPYVT
jgi:hypothetical protein